MNYQDTAQFYPINWYGNLNCEVLFDIQKMDGTLLDTVWAGNTATPSVNNYTLHSPSGGALGAGGTAYIPISSISGQFQTDYKATHGGQGPAVGYYKAVLRIHGVAQWEPSLGSSNVQYVEQSLAGTSVTLFNVLN